MSKCKITGIIYRHRGMNESEILYMRISTQNTACSRRQMHTCIHHSVIHYDRETEGEGEYHLHHTVTTRLGAWWHEHLRPFSWPEVFSVIALEVCVSLYMYRSVYGDVWVSVCFITYCMIMFINVFVSLFIHSWFVCWYLSLITIFKANSTHKGVN